jgi:hypothetical protein
VRGRAIGLASVILAGILVAAEAGPLVLKPFKDRLFAYPQTLSSDSGGAYRVIDYREMRDINGRDAIPQRRARPEYVSLDVQRVQTDLVAPTSAGNIRHFAVGRTGDARVVVIYLHGQGGRRHQGVDDFTFGGNFNRIKNLVAANDGLYLSPDLSDFDERGASEIAALIAFYAGSSPGAPVFVACGSAGGALCWRLAADDRTAPKLAGLLLLGSHWDDRFLTSPAFKRKVPVFFGHGGHDNVFPVERQEAFFRSILAKSPGYPARFVRFETGSHGTPIRMTDWRETLNWMLAAGNGGGP